MLAFAALAAFALTPLLANGVMWARYTQANQAERAAALIHARALAGPSAQEPLDPEQVLALARRQTSPIGGFLAPADALFAALEATPDAELMSLSFTPDGALQGRIRTLNAALPAQLEAALNDKGFVVSTAAASSDDTGALIQDLTVRSGP